MLDKLEAINAKFKDIGVSLTNPEVVSDQKKFMALSKEYSKLEKIVKKADAYKKCLDSLAFAKEVLDTEQDAELKELAKADMEPLEKEREELEETIQQMLIPKDPQDEKNVMLEIRAGTGGDEASIFAGDLVRMYTKFCEKQGWKVTLISANEGTSGGFKEAVLQIEGDDVYGTMKYESGVHRVQRVPATETQGRVHTSAATVAAMPEADEIDFELKESDVKMETSRSGGAGGQNVNKVETKVQLTHIPTGEVVICSIERTQLGNRLRAMEMLRSKLYEAEVRKYEDAIASQRKTLVSSGDRSAKIRTYNWPQGRITDHRIGKTMYNLDAFVNGDLQEMIDALMFAENAEKMKAGQN